MLCVHGGAAHAHWFDFVATGFIEDHHVRAIDLRGHGDSAPGDPQDYLYTRYAAENTPEKFADLLVLADHPDRPAVRR